MAASDFSRLQAHSAVATIAKAMTTAAAGCMSSIWTFFPTGNPCRSLGSLLDLEMAPDEREIRDNVNTDETLMRLADWDVTREHLAYDVRHHYLPPPDSDIHESGRGRGGRYKPFAVRRARMLCRLRKLKCDPRTIRLVLFLKDGWGWEYIRDDCLTSTAKVVGLSLNGLKRYAPSGDVDDFAVDNIIEHQYQAMLSKVDNPSPDLKPTSQETTRFVLGTFGTGEPIKGATGKRISEPLAKAVWPKMGRFQRWLFVIAFDVLTAMLDLRSERMLHRIENAQERNLERGRYDYRCNMFLLRKLARKSVRGRTKGVCFSIVGLGGQAAKIDPKDFVRCGLSMYQMFAAVVGMTVAFSIAFEGLYETLQATLPALTKSLLRKPQHNPKNS